jgi:predicted AAA+ superfamily ATPase
VTRRGNRIVEALQVATHLKDENIRKREFDGLLDALKAYDLKEGLIITENEEETIEVQGYKIEIKPAWKWLSGS